MGMLIEIYRTKDLPDCTRNGISSKAGGLCLVNVEGPFAPHHDAPAAMLVKGNGPGLVKIVPAKLRPEDGTYVATDKWCMMGGNYGATSDSRFHRAVEAIIGWPSYGAVPIHDRIED